MQYVSLIFTVSLMVGKAQHIKPLFSFSLIEKKFLHAQVQPQQQIHICLCAGSSTYPLAQRIRLPLCNMTRPKKTIYCLSLFYLLAKQTCLSSPAAHEFCLLPCKNNHPQQNAGFSPRMKDQGRDIYLRGGYAVRSAMRHEACPHQVKVLSSHCD